MISLIPGNAGLDKLPIRWQPCVYVTTSEREDNQSNNQNEPGKAAVLSVRGAPERLINTNDCHHSDDFVLF